MISYILPTRDRPSDLARTLAALGKLTAHADTATPGEVIVVDNASRFTPVVPNWLPNGLPVRLVFEGANRGAAARNTGASLARTDSRWLVMLDDDSHPCVDDGGRGLIDTLERAPADLAAIGADIWLSDGPNGPRGRESGGLPEVVIGCGVAIRKDAFTAAGGYDPSFLYYAEEYDLCAKLIARGDRIAHSRAWRVIHHKADANRDMNTILARLVRNNAWVMARYCPDDELDERLAEIETRYRSIAEKEGASEGYAAGISEARATLADQPRTPLSREQWDRFTGLAHARAGLRAAHAKRPFRTASIVARGKHDWAIDTALRDLGVKVTPEGTRPPNATAHTQVIGTLSPGPRRDAMDRFGADALSPVVDAITTNSASAAA